MVRLEAETRVAIGMELQGQQGVEVSDGRVTPKLKTVWGFRGGKMFSWLGGRNKLRFMRSCRQEGISRLPR